MTTTTSGSRHRGWGRGRQGRERQRGGLRVAKRLELLGGRDQKTPQVARAMAISALLADARLLLRGERRRVAEREAAVLDAGALDIDSALVAEAQERADVSGAPGELCEEVASLGGARRLGGSGLAALASSEHSPSPNVRGSARSDESSAMNAALGHGRTALEVARQGTPTREYEGAIARGPPRGLAWCEGTHGPQSDPRSTASSADRTIWPYPTLLGAPREHPADHAGQRAGRLPPRRPPAPTPPRHHGRGSPDLQRLHGDIGLARG